MSALDPAIQQKLMNILAVEEQKTDLDNLAVLSRIGMKVASATSAELDADATSASSTALIDLGLRLSQATAQGSLMEIILHSVSGYSLLMAINDEYIVFSGLRKTFRVGYYLGYLRELAKKLNILISGGEISEMSLSLAESELERLKVQELEEESAADAAAAAAQVPSIEEDKAALDDLLGALDEWDKEEAQAMGIDDFEDLEVGNIVSIPKSMTVGLPSSDDSSSDELEIPDFGDLEGGTEIAVEDSTAKAEFKVYKDEVPPVPLEDYTPMDVEEEPPRAAPAAATAKDEYLYESDDEGVVEELPPLDELPSFDELGTPDFGEDLSSASEYDTEFVLEEESESLDSVLKDLGWDED